MLSFYPPALRRDAARQGVKSLVFDLVVLVIATVLIAASLAFVPDSGPTAGGAPAEQAHKQTTQDAKPQPPAYAGLAR